MKIYYLKNKCICITLIFALTVQSCTVYKKTPVSFDDAVATNNKVLVINFKDSIFHYKKIQQIDGVYYGIQKVSGKILKTPLTQNETKAIRIKDKTTSTLVTVGIILIPIIIAVIIIDNSLQDLGDIGGGSV